MKCECGCGYEGEDEVAQWLIEEALLERLDLEESLAKARESERLESDEAVDRSRGRLERVLEAQAAAD